ncbi:hypothetical protein PR048_008761 [Dryococelus australis]|uniref:Uncharacterized protein n=1 Tax=Dryococelus australis TaxID=614101 RepID=A0ABQ9HY14_9NEOP|nr:hypothetical protein PR048_008761 [Dryococelus australis]
MFHNNLTELHHGVASFFSSAPRSKKVVPSNTALCYDGASNMRGPYKEVAARIQKENPLSIYIHCNAHILNRCIVSCVTEVKSIRNTFFTLQTLYNFIEKSSKRHAIFENIRKSSKVFSSGTRALKSLSDTRWSCPVIT